MGVYCHECNNARPSGKHDVYICSLDDEEHGAWDYCMFGKGDDDEDENDNDDSLLAAAANWLFGGNDDSNDNDDSYSSSDSSCYLTTATCDILGLDRNNEYLNKLRKFREDVMRKDEKYFKLLALYDIVGPKVSKALHEDKDKKEISNNIIVKIKEAISLLENNKIDEAIDLYVKTTLGLAEYYGIEVNEISDEVVNNMDVSKAGTGQYIKKKKES